MRMKTAYFIVMTMLWLITSGCAKHYDYVWTEYSITPDRTLSSISKFQGKEVRIIKGKSNNTKRLLGVTMETLHWYGSEQLLTDAIAEQLTSQLNKNQCSVNDSANKSLEIIVNHAVFSEGFYVLSVVLGFTVQMGNENVKQYTVNNRSPVMGGATVDSTFNGAVALAVIEIINDPEVATYLGE